MTPTTTEIFVTGPDTVGEAIPVNEEWEWDDTEIQDDLASYLVLVANQHGSELRSRPEVNSAFLAFATRLAALQHGVVVELLHRVNQQA